MNIISNSCVGGFIYKNELKCLFQNPFIWSLIDFNSMLYLIKNFNSINFNNFELIKDENYNFSIIIDKHIKIQYIHYKYDKNAIEPYTQHINYYSNNIEEYIVQKYVERKNRMLNNKEKTIYIFGNLYDVKDTNLSYNQLKILNDLHKDNIICAVDKIYTEFNYIKQTLKEPLEKKWNCLLAKKIYEEFIR